MNNDYSINNDWDTKLSKMNSKISMLLIIKEKTEKFHKKKKNF